MDAKTFGTFISELRKEKGMTQAELAKCLNVTDKAVSRWERGLGFPDINTLEPLAEVLGISLTELMKCQRIAQPEVDVKEAETMISAGIDIAKYQRAIQRRNIFLGLFFCLIGAAAVFFCTFIHLKNSFAISMIGGADGPTAVFVAGKIGFPLPVTFGVIGGLLILIGIIKLIRGFRAS